MPNRIKIRTLTLCAVTALLLTAVPTLAEDLACLACGKDAKCVKSVIPDFGGQLCERSCVTMAPGGELKELCLCSTSLDCPKDVPGMPGDPGDEPQQILADLLATDSRPTYSVSPSIFADVPGESRSILQLFTGGDLKDGASNGVLAVSQGRRTASYPFTAETTVEAGGASFAMVFRGHPEIREISGTFSDSGKSGFVVIETHRGTTSLAIGE